MAQAQTWAGTPTPARLAVLNRMGAMIDLDLELRRAWSGLLDGSSRRRGGDGPGGAAGARPGSAGQAAAPCWRQPARHGPRRVRPARRRRLLASSAARCATTACCELSHVARNQHRRRASSRRWSSTWRRRWSWLPARWAFERLRLDRWTYNPPLAEAALYVCILGLLVVLL